MESNIRQWGHQWGQDLFFAYKAGLINQTITRDGLSLFITENAACPL